MRPETVTARVFVPSGGLERGLIILLAILPR
jgi:hypothetical protein